MSKTVFISFTCAFVTCIILGLVSGIAAYRVGALIFLLAQVGITIWYFVGRSKPGELPPEQMVHLPVQDTNPPQKNTGEG